MEIFKCLMMYIRSFLIIFEEKHFERGKRFMMKEDFYRKITGHRWCTTALTKTPIIDQYKLMIRNMIDANHFMRFRYFTRNHIEIVRDYVLYGHSRIDNDTYGGLMPIAFWNSIRVCITKTKCVAVMYGDRDYEVEEIVPLKDLIKSGEYFNYKRLVPPKIEDFSIELIRLIDENVEELEEIFDR